ncbi:membrane protein insertion efficiency factor YidD [Canibacter sp. lx-72]|uniref:membrane protein insertion efficiency factor YidD n=1 Tax=Canibacter zhuwentaonis TaxID=2837491 RepID=UPI001BDD385C|nr:membrane protein insertion efficiency factor YidD [Canibacter zhuwentaonis]MBT1018118.1 membrane protein insertion efficiency factor YidD [Canibacter zhuwentaonis]MBT1035347.1 membrane protein insertion efficiency factor YidD [Canibacter zhuwentaonis]
MLNYLLLLPRNIAIAVLRCYRLLISPFYGEVCRYYPSCSRYALEAYQKRSFTVATFLVIWRLLRCNPFTSGGIDDVPQPVKNTSKLTDCGYMRPIKSER